MRESSESSKVAKDVVCGMTIEIAHAAGFSTVSGKNYYFCSLPCKGHFDADVNRYVPRSTGAAPTSVPQSSCCAREIS